MAKTQKGEFLTIVMILGVILILPLTSAGILDFFSGLLDITGFSAEIANVTITLSNSAPNVSMVSDNINASFAPTEASINFIEFSVIVNDSNGASDIDTVFANFSSNTDPTGFFSENVSCVGGGPADSNSDNFSCTIGLEFFDINDDYVIRVTANDSAGASDINDTVTLTWQSLIAHSVSPEQIALASADPDTFNITNSSASDFYNLTNTGNSNATQFNVTAIDLSTTAAGSASTDIIPAANFTIANVTEINSTIEVTECMDPAVDENVTIIALLNTTDRSTGVRVNGTLTRGGESINETVALYLCLRHVPAGIGAYTYNTILGGTWTITSYED